MKELKTEIKRILKAPGKSILTLLTVGTGVGVLILALSISSFFSNTVNNQLQKDGLILTYTNGSFTESDGLEYQRPPVFESNLGDIITQEIDGLIAVAPIISPNFSDIKVNGKNWQVRNAIGTNEKYFEIMDIELVAGDFFTEKDVKIGENKILISRSTAETIYGSVEASIGEAVQPPGRNVRNDRGRNRNVMTSFIITGVYEDPGEIQRKAYRIGDVILPITSMLPPNMKNNTMAMRFINATNIIKVKGSSKDSVESQLRQIVTREYGEGTELHLWEGQPNGNDSDLEETRNTVVMFSFIVNLLGFVLLMTGSIGILSIMLVEALGRSREIALERALGAAKIDIIKEFFIRSVFLSGLSVVIGILISLVFFKPLNYMLQPIFYNIGVAEFTGHVINPSAIILASMSALIIGGIFGIAPAMSLLKANIAESIREG